MNKQLKRMFDVSCVILVSISFVGCDTNQHSKVQVGSETYVVKIGEVNSYPDKNNCSITVHTDAEMIQKF